MSSTPTPLTIGVTSDWHLGQNRHNYLTKDGKRSARTSLRHCADFIVNDALERNLDAFILAGDAFDKGTPTAEDVAFLQDAIVRLTNHGIPVLIEDGNHGRHGVRAGERGPASLLRTAGATVYTEPGIITLDTKNGPLHVLTVPWIERQRYLEPAGALDVDPGKQRDDLIAAYMAEIIEDLVDDADLPAGEHFIAASHTTVSGSVIGGDGLDRGSETVINPAGVFEEVILPVDLFTEIGTEFVGLGHIHQHQNFGNASYAGSIDRLTFGEANSPKGYMNVTLGGEDGLKRELIETPARTLINVRLDREAEPDLSGFVENALIRVHLPEGEKNIPENIREAAEKVGARLVPPKRKPAKRTKTEGTIAEGTTPLDAGRQWAKLNGLDEPMTEKVLNRASTYLAHGATCKH